MKKIVIAFNGPPGCGKDTAAQFAEKYLNSLGYDANSIKFADPLKSTVNQFLRVAFPDMPHEELKPEKIRIESLSFGKTYREAYIAFSEQFAKPLLGYDIFGRLLAIDIADWQPEHDDARGIAFVVSDAGFAAEQVPVVELVGHNSYALVRLHRNGHTFSGDSRSYQTVDRVNNYDLINNGTLDDLAAEVQKIIDIQVRDGGW